MNRKEMERQIAHRRAAGEARCAGGLRTVGRCARRSVAGRSPRAWARSSATRIWSAAGTEYRVHGDVPGRPRKSPSRAPNRSCPGSPENILSTTASSSRSTSTPDWSHRTSQCSNVDEVPSLNNASVLVTGAGRGIGKRLAIGFAARGAQGRTAGAQQSGNRFVPSGNRPCRRLRLENSGRCSRL